MKARDLLRFAGVPRCSWRCPTCTGRCTLDRGHKVRHAHTHHGKRVNS